MTSIKIVSNGKPTGTFVYGPNGERMTGITAIKIHPIGIESPIVLAEITFSCVELELDAFMESKA